MIVSDKILPIRFYDSLYDQNRFSKNCHDTCQLNLVYPSSVLPHFQINRTALFAVPSDFYLRSVCTDIEYNYYKEIAEGADSFCNSILSNAVWGGLPKKEIIGYTMDDDPILGPNDNLITDCCKLKNVFNNAWPIQDLTTTLSIPFSIKRKVKICVDKFVSTTGFKIEVYNDTVLYGTITAAGTYFFDYVDNGSGILTIKFPNYVAGDYFEISEIQVWNDITNLYLQPNDIQLAASDISVFNKADGTDIMSYCLPASYTSNIPDGEYYYVVKSGSTLYFSEVFKIVSLKTLDNYFKITWYDDCDFNNSVLYNSSSIVCNFRNVLYLDSALFKPEYDTIEEIETNGQGDENTRFKRWQKNISLEVGKSPEFLTDALSAIFLHDSVTVLSPLNLYQGVQNNTHTVLKVTNDISDIIDSCYQRVVLKLLLSDKITDTVCCTPAEKLTDEWGGDGDGSGSGGMSSMVYGENGFTISGRITPYTWGKVFIDLDNSGIATEADTFYVDSTGNYAYLLTNAFLFDYLPFDTIALTVYNVKPGLTLGFTNTMCLGIACP